MALINCPKCGHENVSDTTNSCPYCGCNVKNHLEIEKKKNELEEKKKNIKYRTCPECKYTEVPEDKINCPKCGFNVGGYYYQLQQELAREAKKEERETLAGSVCILLVLHVLCLIIGHSFGSAFGIGIILIASIVFVSLIFKVDYVVYQDKWILYTVAMAVVTIFNGAILIWIALCIIACSWRLGEGKK